MTTTVNLRKLLDRKQWEMCNFAPNASAAGSFIVSSNLEDQHQYYFVSAATILMYDPTEDAWTYIPASGAAGTFGAGACGCRHPYGPSGTATAGTTTTVTTNLTLARSLKGYKIRITGGTNAGQERTILKNTVGANSIITVDSAFGSAIDTSSTYQLLSGRLWFLNAGTTATGIFKYYDYATNTWTNGGTTNLPASIGTDGRLVSTPGYVSNFATGTATSGSSTTLVNSVKNWTVNQWANFQVRITSGTGAGQIRIITSNTSTTLTVPTWTTAPDNTSVYVIEGADDYLYYLGNNAVTMYRYSISGATWTVLSPGVARGAAPASGMSANWIWDVNDTGWTSENVIQNGRYLYSWRGNGSAVMDRYDIPSNAWSTVSWAPATETITVASSHTYNKNYIYTMLGNTGRMIKFDIVIQEVEPHTQLWYTQGAAVVGDKMFDITYTDGATEITWFYFLTHTQATLFRQLNIE